MSLASEINNPAIDSLVESSLESKEELLRLKWISCTDITDVEQTQIDNVYKDINNMHLLLGSSEECTPALLSEFARIYSLPTHHYNSVDSCFRRYSKWLQWRNELIKGFTKYDNNYYMVADGLFYCCYSRYGFCSACGILRSSPVWCICGHKELISGWTSNNKQLDDFIKKTQLEADSPKDQYVEWIPFDFVSVGNTGIGFHLCGLPVTDCKKLIPLEITDKTDVSYYDKVTVEYIYIMFIPLVR